VTSEEFLARTAEEYSLSFSQLYEDFYENRVFYENFENADFDLFEELKRFV